MGIDIRGVNDVQEDLDDLQASLSSPEAAAVGASADHANDVEFGTDPHTIEATNAEALHFELEGEEVFVKSVQHPGTEPQPFLRPARTHVQMNAREYIEDAPNLSGAVKLAAIDAVKMAKREAPVDDGDLQNSIRWEWL